MVFKGSIQFQLQISYSVILYEKLSGIKLEIMHTVTPMLITFQKRHDISFVMTCNQESIQYEII